MSAAKKQPARKAGRGKKVYNWQAARQNGPKPLIIGKGKKVETSEPAKPAGKAVEKATSKDSVVSTPATSVADDALSTKSEKTDWAEDA